MTLPTGWRQRIHQHLDRIDRLSQTRMRLMAHGPVMPSRDINGRVMLSFASNDYLGLAADERLRGAMTNALERYGLGAGSAQHLGGYTTAHAALEERLADWLGQPRAMLFSSGYMANLGLICGLLSRHDRLYMDRLNHASLIDAARLSGASLKRYRHLDLLHLQQLMSGAETVEDEHSGLAMISSESVFSMDGDVAAVAALMATASEHQALLAIDEAHALGVLGKTGAGHVEELELATDNKPVVTGTFGKSLGTFGAFVAGDEDLIEQMLQSSRTAMFTTALPPALVATTQFSLELLINESGRRERLNQNISQFRTQAIARNIPVLESRTAIQPVMVGENDEAVKLSAWLSDQGLYVPAIRPPTVPAGQARLRVSLSSAHDDSDINALVTALDEYYSSRTNTSI